MAALAPGLAGLFVRSGRLTQAQMDEVLTRPYQTIIDLVDELCARGWITDTECARILSDGFGLPLVDLADVGVTPQARRSVPSELARKFTVVPLDVAAGRLRVALADPRNVRALDDIKFVSRLEVVPVLAALGQIRQAIERVYGPEDHSTAMLDALADDAEEIERHDPTAELRSEAVDFSVFAPPSVAPGGAFVVELWAYLRRQRAEVLSVAGRHGRSVELSSRGPVCVPIETELTVLLRLDSFTLERRREVMFWTGTYVNVQFPVHVPASTIPGDYVGEFVVLRAGMRLTSVMFQVTVGTAQPRASLAVTPKPVRTAFASYAAGDRDEVLRRVQGITATGVDVFLDVVSLRAGDDWEQALLRNIRERDVFYLFWSRAACDSEWVEKEWRYALKERGPEYIHPIPLADPREVPPPPDLASKHFNDLLLACMVSMRLGA